MKAELDDERREVPDGWVRAFDRKSGHHFYALADPSAASQSTWTHPYDSPAFLSTLPSGHPANPSSSAAQAYAQKAAEEQAANGKASKGKEEKGWLAKTLGKVVGDGPSHDEKKAISDAEENFVKRRGALINGDVNALGTKRKYAKDPFAYTAPSEPFNRYASSEVKYAFGYFGGYQRKYNPAQGYDRVAKPPAGYMDNVMNSWMQGAGSPVTGLDKKTNYGYSG